jgi:protein-tyrosine phosphatase
MTAETLNYTKAAQQLYISRQALRQALSGMEKELGVALFMNEHNKLSLTAAGEYMKLSGKEVVQHFDTLLTGIQRFADQEVVLPVAFSTALFPFLLPEIHTILQRFQERYPSICLDMKMMSNDEVIEGIESGEIACGGAAQIGSSGPGIGMEVLIHSKVVVSYNDNHPLDSKEMIRVEDLEGMNCIGMGSLQKSMPLLYQTCQEKGLTFQYGIVKYAIDAFYQIVHGNVVGIDVGKEGVPDLGGIHDSCLEDYFWDIGLLYQKNYQHSREVQIFCRFMAEEYERMKAEQRDTGISSLSGF